MKIKVGDTVRVVNRNRLPERGPEDDDGIFARKRPVRGRVVYAGVRFAVIRLFARDTEKPIYCESFWPGELAKEREEAVGKEA